MKMKRVLCHINNLNRGGAERVMSVLIDSMVNDGIEVVLVTLDKGDDEYSIPNNVSRVELDKDISNNRLLKAANRIIRLRKTIKENKPDIVLSFCSKENYRSSLALWGIKTPLVVSVRSNPAAHYKRHSFMTIYMGMKAKGCVFQSLMAKEYFAETLQKKSRIITNPIDKSYLNKTAKPAGKCDGTYRIVTASRLAKEKNQGLLAEAFAKIAKKYPKAQLYFYGKDDCDGTSDIVKGIADRNGLNGRINIMGAYDKLVDELLLADVFVLPSNFEGMPNALIEAMSIGLPSIATDCPCGGPASLIENGKNGILVPVGDADAMAEAMDTLLNDDEMRINMGLEATKIREMVNTDFVYGQWKNYMETLM